MAEWALRCPYGHAAIELGSDRFWCNTCHRADRDMAYPKDDLVRLDEGEVPPHAD